MKIILIKYDINAILTKILKMFLFIERKVEIMKKKLNLKSKIAALALLTAGATTAVPAVVPQVAMAAETTAAQNTNGSYQIVRNINFYYKNDDGSTTFGGSAPYTYTVPYRNMQVTFPEIKVADLFNGGLGYWKPDREIIPAVKATYDNPPADENIYLSLDKSSYTEESKTIKRTVNYYYVDTDGKKSSAGKYSDSVTFKRGGYIDASGNKVMYDWSGDYTFKELAVEQKTGYTVNMEKVPAKTVTPADSDFEVEVIYSKIPTRTETKEIKRKINLIGKNADGTTTNLGGAEQSATISRVVYTDTDGTVKVLRDWNTAGIPEYSVPDRTGYTKQQATVPAMNVTSSSKDTEVNVYYDSNVKTYTVKYHLDDNSAASSKSTTVTYGKLTPTLSISDLGFSKANQVFKGWKAYREVDDTWYVKDSNGKNSFKKLVNGQLPAGHSFVLYKNGESVKATAQSGIVHFYAQWEQRQFTVKYHQDDNSAASSKSTTVNYGTLTPTLSISELGFSKANFIFKGWKAYRESDDTWFMKDSNGKNSFKKLVNGQLPAGHAFVLYKNGESVKATAPSGNVHFYAQWEQRQFTIKYHSDDSSAASARSTTVNYGTFTKTLSYTELGFANPGKTFAGWKAYREVDDTWFMRDPDGNKVYKKLVNGQLPAGHTFILYKNAESVKATAPSGIVHFYAQWR